MLSSILSKEECARCRFCCAFKRQSLWETPLFDAESVAALAEKYRGAKFKKSGDMFTVDIDGSYKTQNPDEEAPCPFLNTESGCVLRDDEKPFDCKIWPLRIMNKSGKILIALTPTCPVINNIPIERVVDLVEKGLGNVIFDEAKKTPGIIKEYREGFPVLIEFDETL